MLVTRTNFDDILFAIERQYYRSLDTETTGLFPFHGDRLFSIIVGTEVDTYYFNWNEYPGLPQDLLLTPEHLKRFGDRLLKGDAYWFIHKAIYDLPILAQDGLSVAGTIHCTRTGARVQYNEHHKYTLDACAHRIKEKKDDTVENYIKAHKLYTWKEINGKKVKYKRYDLVPFEIISQYGLRDGAITYKLGKHQLEQIQNRSERMPKNRNTLRTLHENELRLEKTIHRMQMRGALTNQEYCRRAVEYNQSVMDNAASDFQKETGHQFMLSGKLFAEIFESEKDKWSFTEKGNPSFDGDALEKFENPAAKHILAFKKAKSEIDFYHNFILYADKDGVIHTDFNSGGTRTGRFSSSNPNLQNLKKDEGEALDAEFVVRRAIIPRTGFFFAMIDYDQIEYRMMADYAGCNELIDKVLGGLDVHTATAQVAGITRSEAKTVNFGVLYGQGLDALARSLGVTRDRAKQIRDTIFNAAPEIRNFIWNVTGTAEKRGFIFNWLGRVCYFPKRNLCYKAPNTLIQGGAGDVVKKAMNEVDEFLLDKQSSLVLNIHDELVFEIAYEEAHILPEIKRIMESVYPYNRLPLTAGIDWSGVSLADKRPWEDLQSFHGKETRDKIQGKNIPAAQEHSEVLVRKDSASGITGDSRFSGGR